MALRNAAACLALLLLAAPAGAGVEDRLGPYAYADTRELVEVVDDAAALIAEKGTDAFVEFDVPGSRWLNERHYVFVYRSDGLSVFHPITREWVGKNMLDLRDSDGKPVVRLITDVTRRPEPDASAWEFYRWQAQTQFTPGWKAAYIRKTTAPDGTVYAVGSGLYSIKIEKHFVADRVDKAVDLILSEGRDAAFRAFGDRASPFNFLDTGIFVLDMQGHTLVDPVSQEALAGRDLSGFEDAVGFRAVAEVLRKLRTADEAWVQYLWPKPGSDVPSRKLLYVRKVTVGGQAIAVGADFYLASPIWMKFGGAASWPVRPA